MINMASYPTGRTFHSTTSRAIAATHLNHSSPIQIVSGATARYPDQLLRLRFLDRTRHIRGQRHNLHQEEALVLAANKQRVLGSQAMVQAL